MRATPYLPVKILLPKVCFFCIYMFPWWRGREISAKYWGRECVTMVTRPPVRHTVRLLMLELRMNKIKVIL